MSDERRCCQVLRPCVGHATGRRLRYRGTDGRPHAGFPEVFTEDVPSDDHETAAVRALFGREPSDVSGLAENLQIAAFVMKWFPENPLDVIETASPEAESRIGAVLLGFDMLEDGDGASLLYAAQESSDAIDASPPDR